MFGDETVTKYMSDRGVQASVIGTVEKAPIGNVVLRVGRLERADGSWFQTEHVVLTPDEARALVSEIEGLLS